MRAMLVGGLLLASACGHLPPGSTDNLPPPWPATSPSLTQRAAPADSNATPTTAPAKPAAPEPAAGKPPVPPLKPELLPSPTPTPPQSQ